LHLAGFFLAVEVGQLGAETLGDATEPPLETRPDLLLARLLLSGSPGTFSMEPFAPPS